MGRPVLPADEKRSVCLSVHLSPTESAQVLENARAAGMSPGAFCRAVALRHQLVAAVPEPNRAAYSQLARAVANLNQIAHCLNTARLAGEPICASVNMDSLAAEIPRVATLVQQLRRALIGLDEVTAVAT